MAGNKQKNTYRCPKCHKEYYGPLQLQSGELCCPLCGQSIVPDFCVTAQSEEEYCLGESCYLSYLESFAQGNCNEQLRDRALTLFRKAAYRGHPEAIVRMGYFYEKHLNYGGVVNSQNAAINFYKKVIGDYNAIVGESEELYLEYIKWKLQENTLCPGLADPVLKAYIDYVLSMDNAQCRAFVGCDLRDPVTRNIRELTRTTVLQALKQRVNALRVKTAYYLFELSQFLVDTAFDDALKEAVIAILNKDDLLFTRFKNESQESGDAFFVEVAAKCKEKRDNNDGLFDPDGNTPLFGFVRVDVEQAKAIHDFNLQSHIFPDGLYWRNGSNNEYINTNFSLPDIEPVVMYFFNKECTRLVNGRNVSARQYAKYLVPTRDGSGKLHLHADIHALADSAQLNPGVVYYIDDLVYLLHRNR